MTSYPFRDSTPVLLFFLTVFISFIFPPALPISPPISSKTDHSAIIQSRPSNNAPFLPPFANMKATFAQELQNNSYNNLDPTSPLDPIKNLVYNPMGVSDPTPQNNYHKESNFLSFHSTDYSPLVRMRSFYHFSSLQSTPNHVKNPAVNYSNLESVRIDPNVRAVSIEVNGSTKLREGSLGQCVQFNSPASLCYGIIPPSIPVYVPYGWTLRTMENNFNAFSFLFRLSTSDGCDNALLTMLCTATYRYCLQDTFSAKLEVPLIVPAPLDVCQPTCAYIATKCPSYVVALKTLINQAMGQITLLEQRFEDIDSGDPNVSEQYLSSDEISTLRYAQTWAQFRTYLPSCFFNTTKPYQVVTDGGVPPTNTNIVDALCSPTTYDEHFQDKASVPGETSSSPAGSYIADEVFSSIMALRTRYFAKAYESCPYPLLPNPLLGTTKRAVLTNIVNSFMLNGSSVPKFEYSTPYSIRDEMLSLFSRFTEKNIDPPSLSPLHYDLYETMLEQYRDYGGGDPTVPPLLLLGMTPTSSCLLMCPFSQLTAPEYDSLDFTAIFTSLLTTFITIIILIYYSFSQHKIGFIPLVVLPYAFSSKIIFISGMRGLVSYCTDGPIYKADLLKNFNLTYVFHSLFNSDSRSRFLIGYQNVSLFFFIATNTTAQTYILVHTIDILLWVCHTHRLFVYKHYIYPAYHFVAACIIVLCSVMQFINQRHTLTNMVYPYSFYTSGESTGIMDLFYYTNYTSFAPFIAFFLLFISYIYLRRSRRGIPTLYLQHAFTQMFLFTALLCVFHLFLVGFAVHYDPKINEYSSSHYSYAACLRLTADNPLLIPVDSNKLPDTLANSLSNNPILLSNGAKLQHTMYNALLSHGYTGPMPADFDAQSSMAQNKPTSASKRYLTSTNIMDCKKYIKFPPLHFFRFIYLVYTIVPLLYLITLLPYPLFYAHILHHAHKLTGFPMLETWENLNQLPLTSRLDLIFWRYLLIPSNNGFAISGTDDNRDERSENEQQPEQQVSVEHSTSQNSSLGHIPLHNSITIDNDGSLVSVSQSACMVETGGSTIENYTITVLPQVSSTIVVSGEGAPAPASFQDIFFQQPSSPPPLPPPQLETAHIPPTSSNLKAKKNNKVKEPTHPTLQYFGQAQTYFGPHSIVVDSSTIFSSNTPSTPSEGVSKPPENLVLTFYSITGGLFDLDYYNVSYFEYVLSSLVLEPSRKSRRELFEEKQKTKAKYHKNLRKERTTDDAVEVVELKPLLAKPSRSDGIQSKNERTALKIGGNKNYQIHHQGVLFSKLISHHIGTSSSSSDNEFGDDATLYPILPVCKRRDNKNITSFDDSSTVSQQRLGNDRKFQQLSIQNSRYHPFNLTPYYRNGPPPTILEEEEVLENIPNQFQNAVNFVVKKDNNDNNNNQPHLDNKIPLIPPKPQICVIGSEECTTHVPRMKKHRPHKRRVKKSIRPDAGAPTNDTATMTAATKIKSRCSLSSDTRALSRSEKKMATHAAKEASKSDIVHQLKQAAHRQGYENSHIIELQVRLSHRIAPWSKWLYWVIHGWLDNGPDSIIYYIPLPDPPLSSALGDEKDSSNQFDHVAAHTLTRANPSPNNGSVSTTSTPTLTSNVQSIQAVNIPSIMLAPGTLTTANHHRISQSSTELLFYQYDKFSHDKTKIIQNQSSHPMPRISVVIRSSSGSKPELDNPTILPTRLLNNLIFNTYDFQSFDEPNFAPQQQRYSDHSLLFVDEHNFLHSHNAFRDKDGENISYKNRRNNLAISHSGGVLSNNNTNTISPRRKLSQSSSFSLTSSDEDYDSGGDNEDFIDEDDEDNFDDEENVFTPRKGLSSTQISGNNLAQSLFTQKVNRTPEQSHDALMSITPPQHDVIATKRGATNERGTPPNPQRPHIFSFDHIEYLQDQSDLYSDHINSPTIDDRMGFAQWNQCHKTTAAVMHDAKMGLIISDSSHSHTQSNTNIQSFLRPAESITSTSTTTSTTSTTSTHSVSHTNASCNTLSPSSGNNVLLILPAPKTRKNPPYSSSGEYSPNNPSLMVPISPYSPRKIQDINDNKHNAGENVKTSSRFAIDLLNHPRYHSSFDSRLELSLSSTSSLNAHQVDSQAANMRIHHQTNFLNHHHGQHTNHLHRHSSSQISPQSKSNSDNAVSLKFHFNNTHQNTSSNSSITTGVGGLQPLSLPFNFSESGDHNNIPFATPTTMTPHFVNNQLPNNLTASTMNPLYHSLSTNSINSPNTESAFTTISNNPNHFTNKNLQSPPPTNFGILTINNKFSPNNPPNK